MNKIIKCCIIFLVCGFAFFLAGYIGLKSMPDKEDMLEVTGVIVDIEVDGTEDNQTHKAYVEYEIENQTYEQGLNYYSSSFKVGQEITLYYEEEKPEKVYVGQEEGFFKMFKILGIAIFAFGASVIGYKLCKERGII